MTTSKPSEETLWTLHKAERTAEARTGTEGGRPELRIYTGSGKNATWVLSSFQVVKDRQALRAAAEEKKREFVASGWGDSSGEDTRQVGGDHDEPRE